MMIEIPAPRFGHRPARVVDDDAVLPVQLKLPARVVRALTLRANAAGTTMSYTAAESLARQLDVDWVGPAAS